MSDMFGAERGYTIAQAARITGHTRNQLEYLDRTELVRPSLVRPGGKRRYYTFFDLVELRTLARLRGSGRISLQVVRKVVAELEKVRDRPLRTCTLLSDGDTVYWVDEGANLVDVLGRFQLVIAVNLHGLEHEVRRELAAIGLEAPPVLPHRARAA